ncbi:hypothetical protein TPHA_0A05980 [Tetrapisispora phaffii CBS 4417]|uniref:Transcriptional activator HAP2 n=1 Tax=Tetrapisispora phaffii (strain ATCC 24235 / CBS 4417 / NBRC 1672 / NRRL Y-8282 / UCD 70-5) TaxID=1071381 RepID=G8BP44_TETPH|nr:hypothetical protein TPHA_0A05980 [Tetrapisispora phaffii CBS 4417]CCE61672.1 hypothetical protein TPHA_0A05980 [Tetrapisispora phaffii CBS 4417]
MNENQEDFSSLQNLVEYNQYEVEGENLSDIQIPAPTNELNGSDRIPKYIYNEGQNVHKLDAGGSSNNNQNMDGIIGNNRPTTSPTTASESQNNKSDSINGNQVEPFSRLENDTNRSSAKAEHYRPAEVNLPDDKSSNETTTEKPFYVNAKQYYRILKRRYCRARLEENLRISRERKPYLHESRHKHAMRRPRGQGGRFLTAVEIEALKLKENAKSGSGGQISSETAAPYNSDNPVPSI